MKFIENEIYLDREDNEYKFLKNEKGLLVFYDTKNDKTIVNHSSDRYRWDNKDHPRDMVKKK